MSWLSLGGTLERCRRRRETPARLGGLCASGSRHPSLSAAACRCEYSYCPLTLLKIAVYSFSPCCIIRYFVPIKLFLAMADGIVKKKDRGEGRWSCVLPLRVMRSLFMLEGFFSRPVR